MTILDFLQLTFQFIFSLKVGLLTFQGLEVKISLPSTLVSQESWLEPGLYLTAMENKSSGWRGMKIQKQFWKQQRGL